MISPDTDVDAKPHVPTTTIFGCCAILTGFKRTVK